MAWQWWPSPPRPAPVPPHVWSRFGLRSRSRAALQWNLHTLAPSGPPLYRSWLPSFWDSDKLWPYCWWIQHPSFLKWDIYRLTEIAQIAMDKHIALSFILATKSNFSQRTVEHAYQQTDYYAGNRRVFLSRQRSCWQACPSVWTSQSWWSRPSSQVLQLRRWTSLSARPDSDDVPAVPIQHQVLIRCLECNK